MLASRHLLFSEVRVPRLDPAPRRKRGAGFKTRVVDAPVGRCGRQFDPASFLVFEAVPSKLEKK